jgi:TFIIS helical bundle-like domain
VHTTAAERASRLVFFPKAKPQPLKSLLAAGRGRMAPTTAAEMIVMREAIDKTADDSQRLADMLHQLSSVELTVDVMAESRIGASVSRYKKHSDENVAQLAKNLIKKWKRLASEAGVSRNNRAAVSTVVETQETTTVSVTDVPIPRGIGTLAAAAAASAAASAASSAASAAGLLRADSSDSVLSSASSSRESTVKVVTTTTVKTQKVTTDTSGLQEVSSHCYLSTKFWLSYRLRSRPTDSRILISAVLL